ncbi:hypothetical protein HHK36_000813 [Tetracentron sinense]|uniref:Uncharacterized protein n=1 Tax=Tetracentron sinense TaxID=13715 RepID=A0A834ZSU8_TETSI|nr:hypothetical protein HHK36_000813 [Tetracentron sinense]
MGNCETMGNHSKRGKSGEKEKPQMENKETKEKTGKEKKRQTPDGKISKLNGQSSLTHLHCPSSCMIYDILGGSTLSDRIGANSQVNGLPFSKPNGNNNNMPFLTGLGGGTNSTVIQNNGGNTLPFVSAGQLPAGATLQKLMYGTITVIDDELTEGHELGVFFGGEGTGILPAQLLITWK